MTGDREQQNMTQTDIAHLLADAADEVEIGIAPVQAVIQAGRRRRRARRWAVAAATAAVLAGSTGATLALAGLPGGDRQTGVAAGPSTAEARHVYRPQRTPLGTGTDRGSDWRVELTVWGAPRDRAEAAGQLTAMRKFGLTKTVLPPGPDGLVNRTSYYASLYLGDDRKPRVLVFDNVEKWDRMSGRDVSFGALPLAKEGATGSDRLAVGRVAGTAQQVKCTWKKNESTVDLPVAAAGSPDRWFLCLAPEGESVKAAEVIQ
ncbi:hypothetical protein ACF1GS_37560 [Streptomyces eurythermus]|uniref:hypothetical protein n=1 Tax=Streptomyces eurythermus TaxID=42237 RepID=UPI0037012DAE